MNRKTNIRSRSLAAAIAVLLLGMVASDAQARLFAKSSATAVAAKSTSLSGDCYQPCVRYRHHRGCKVCCDCGPPLNVVLEVKDPGCCGCAVEVSVCVPHCCTGAPCVSSRCGLLGRGIVEYCWDCGYRVRVVFDRHGDLIVHTYGS